MSVNPYDMPDEQTGDSADGAEALAGLSAPPPAAPTRAGGRSSRQQMFRANVILAVLFASGLGSVYFLSMRKLPKEANADEQVAEIQVDNLIQRLGQHTDKG